MTEYFQIMGHNWSVTKLVTNWPVTKLVTDWSVTTLVTNWSVTKLVTDWSVTRPVRRSFVVDMREVFACENVSNFTSISAYNQHQVRYFVISRVAGKMSQASCEKSRQYLSHINDSREKKLLRARP
jgi:hypothetical protein